MNHLRLELKVCEGCGTLWVRADRASGVYCATCVRRLAEFPTVRSRRLRARTRVSRALSAGCAGGAR